MKVEKSNRKRLQLKSLLKECSVKNKSLELSNVYSVTNSKGFVPASDYFDNTVQSNNLSTYKIVDKGMFAYNPSRINVGSIALLSAEDRVIVSPLYVIFSIVGNLNPNYLLRFLKSEIGLSLIRSKTSGSVRASLRFKDLASIELPVPSLSEQESIASELDALQEVIESYREQISDLDALAQSIFLNTFGDPTFNPKGWPIRYLKDIALIGTGATPSRKNLDFYEGDIPWVKSTEVRNNYIYATQEHITSEAIENSNCRIYPTNTVLIAMYGQGKTRGQVGLLKIPATTNQACAAIQCKQELDSLFAYWHLQMCYDTNRQLGHGTNQNNMNLSIVGNLRFIFPPFEIQQKFAKRVEAIENQKELLRRQLADAEMLMAERMQYYFS